MRVSMLALGLALSLPAHAGKKKAAEPPMQAPNVAAAAMVQACERTKTMGRDALAKALGSANGTDPRMQGKSVWDHFATLQANEVAVDITVTLPSTMRVDRAGLQAAQSACMAKQATDAKGFQECAPKLQELNLAFAGVQTAVLDTGMALLLANNISYGCRAQAVTTATNAEKTNLIGGGAPDYAADDVHYRKILEGAQQGEALAAGVNTLVAAYQAMGAGELAVDAAKPLIEALPTVLEQPVEVGDAELEALHQQARADAAADPMIQQAIKDMDAWAKENNGGVKAPEGGFGAALNGVVGGLASGSFSKAAQGLLKALPEDNPVRAGLTCLAAIADKDFKTAFKSARSLLPKGSKLRSALEALPV